MRLIDASNFTKAPYVIANASANPSSAMENACEKVIDDIVGNLQSRFISSVLGDDGDEVVRSLDSASSLEELPDGVKSICMKLVGPFSSYVYFHILRHAQSVSGITGVFQLVSSDKGVSPRFKQVEAWNSMALTLRALCLEMGWKHCDCGLLKTVNQFNI